MTTPAPKRSHSRTHPCPVCGGYDEAPRGQGVRCFGFSANGTHYCTREDKAGAAPFKEGADAYAHKATGSCPCGVEHEPAPIKQAAGAKKIEAVFSYQNRDSSLAFQVVRYSPKRFSQRRPDGKGGFIWNLDNFRGKDGNGKPVGDVQGLPLYALPELLKANPAIPVYFFEGEKHAERATREGLVATTTAMGAGKSDRSDLTPLQGRHVVILPDDDNKGRDHAREVANAIYLSAASVKVLELPGLADLKPKGADIIDWLDAGHTVDELQALAEAAPHYEPPAPAAHVVDLADEEGDEDEPKATTPTLASALLESYHFARDVGGRLHVYRNGGVYIPDGERFVRAEVKAILSKWRIPQKWSVHRCNEVAEYIKADAPELWERPPLDTVNVANGLLDVETGELRPHSPGWLSPVQLPVTFDPDATCPAIDRFHDDVLPRDCHDLAVEIIGWLMVPDVSPQKAVLLLGEGGNGKSTWLNMVRQFLGRRNTASASLHRLESDRFTASRLLGKLANICADLPSAHLESTDAFKAITDGQDGISAEFKFRDGFDFFPFARLLFSANHPPRSRDASKAFFDRWLPIPFERTFRGERGEVPRHELDARLTAPGELSGLLNKALDGLRRLQDRGRFTPPASVQVAFAEFRATTDPFAVWLDQQTVEAPDCLVAKDELRRAYNKDATANSRPTMTDTAIGLALKAMRPQVSSKQRTVNGKVTWCWLGIGLKSTEGPGHSHGSQGSQRFSYFVNRARPEGEGAQGDSKGKRKQDRENAVNPVKSVNAVARCAWPGCDRPATATHARTNQKRCSQHALKRE